jgi:hypothetical protein
MTAGMSSPSLVQGQTTPRLLFSFSSGSRTRLYGGAVIEDRELAYLDEAKRAGHVGCAAQSQEKQETQRGEEQRDEERQIIPCAVGRRRCRGSGRSQGHGYRVYVRRR